MFNTFGSRKREFGGHTPIWLGVVSPVPFGGTLAASFLLKDMLVPAGTPVKLSAGTNGTITPVLAYKVTAVSQVDGTGDTITIKPVLGVKPTTNTVLMKLGSSFSTTGKAYKPSAVAANATDSSLLDLTYTYQKLGALAVGDILVTSDAEGASKAPNVVPNGYLYNDICLKDIDVDEDFENATGAVVDFHGEGLLISRNPIGCLMADQLQSQIPNVKLVKGV